MIAQYSRCAATARPLPWTCRTMAQSETTGGTRRSTTACCGHVSAADHARRVAMYVQVVNFNLKDTTEQEYRAVCEQEAPLFGELPGLIAKYWLADPETNTYGGVY